MRTDLGRAPARRGWRNWRVLHNLPQKIGALVAAIALWFAATGDRQAVVERTFDAPLQTRGKTENQDVTGLPATVSVTLAGGRDRLESLRSSTVEAYVNLAGVSLGNFEAPVTIVPPVDTRVARTSPREVAGHLDVVESATVPVRAATTDLPGDAIVHLRVQPPQVTVTGPRTRLASVAYALAVVAVDAAEATLTAVDENGQPVEGISLRPAKVRVERTQVPAVLEKTLPLQLAAAPAGLQYRSRSLSRNQVTVFGPPDVVGRLTAVTARPAVPLQPGTMKVPVTLDLPSGVTVAPDGNITATLVVVPRA